MKIGKIVRRFVLPGWAVTFYLYLKYRCMVSPRSEIEVTRFLKIGSNSSIGSFTKVRSSDGPLSIGKDVQISTSVEINSGEAGISIGDDCLIGACSSIIGNNYRYDRTEIPIRLQDKTSKGIQIENNVWVGSGVRILDGSVIGFNSIITPNSVVSSNIPPNSIFQGNPGKVIFTRR